MKLIGSTLGLLLLALIIGACSDSADDPAPTAPDQTMATLVYAQRMANADLRRGARSDKATSREGQIIDTRHARLKIEVSQGTVVDGHADTCEWIEIYDSHDEVRDSDRVFAPAILPVGVYDNLRITTDSDQVIWECAFGDDVVDIPMATSPVMVFGDGGLYGYAEGSGVLVSIAPGERLGGFEVRADVTTHLTFVSNLDSLTWNDADGSGDWSDGDQAGGVSGLPGTDTMGSFITEYVDEER